MDHNSSTRRLFLQSAGVASTVMIAGCSGDSSDDEDSSDDSTNEDLSDDSTDEDSSDERESVFVNYGVDGIDLLVELTENSLSQVAQIRVKTPSEEKTTEVSETITQYSVDILRDRAGTWFIDALDSGEEVIETAELETTFEVSVDDIGTLSQLGVTGDSPETEHTSIQFTVTNNGDVPVSPGGRNGQPANIGITVSSLDEEVSVSAGYDDVVVGSGENIVPSGGQRTYRYEPSEKWPDQFLMFTDDNLEDKLGQSFQGSITIQYVAEREDTVIPMLVNLGDEMREMNPPTHYAIGTTISKR